jgi:hypothetical protein
VTMAFMSYQAYVVRNQLAEVFEQAGTYRTQFIASVLCAVFQIELSRISWLTLLSVSGF